jgi:hypothetical protein
VAQSTVEKRVSLLEKQVAEQIAALERQVAELRMEVAKLSEPKDWRSTIGLFAADEGMKQIFEAGRKIREKDQEKARMAAARAEERERIAAEKKLQKAREAVSCK